MRRAVRMFHFRNHSVDFCLVFDSYSPCFIFMKPKFTYYIFLNVDHGTERPVVCFFQNFQLYFKQFR